MTPQQNFEKNVKRWSIFCPVIADLLPSFAVTGSWDAEAYKREQAEKWKETLDFGAFQVLYVYGLNDLAPYEILKEWLQDKNHQLVILESNLEKIAQYFYTQQATEVLEKENIWLYYLDPEYRILSECAQIFCSMPFFVSTIYSDPDSLAKLDSLKSQIAFFHNFHSAHINEHKNYGLQYYSNYFLNIFFLPHGYLGDGLFNQFKDVPAIICGAGPSLAKNMHLLNELKDKAIIFGGGSAMNALNAAGILPHVGVGIDPNKEQITRTIMNNAFDVPFFYRNRMHHHALNLIQGNKLYVSGSSGYSIGQYFDEALELKGIDLDEGFNVATFSVSLAAAMGCNPIICVGIDLAYSENKSYPSGMFNHPIHQQFRTKDMNDELTFRHDIYGQPVPTLWKWINESLWFSNFGKSNPQIKFMNATEGGIGFSGIPNCTLASAAEEFLEHQESIETRLQGEIQAASLTKSVKTEKLIDLCDSLVESLGLCAQLLDGYLAKLSEHKNKKEELLALSEAEVIKTIREEWLKELKETLGYRYMLIDFDHAFNSLEKRELLRLLIDKELLKPEEWLDKLLTLELKRAFFLQQTALVNQGQIKQVVLQETIKLNQSIISTTEPFSLDLEAIRAGYRYEDGQLTMIDSECFLNRVEAFHPLNEDIIRIWDESGNLKYESYRKNNQLHGPARFYGKNQNILAESWYIDGLQEGKAFIYDMLGSLRSLSQYHHGLKQGRQIELFEDGKLKALINYKNGLLEGEVALYYPSGNKSRQLHYANGVREGKEFFWNEIGQLIIEAEFKEGRSVGIARVWYPNSTQLAEEITYNENSEIVSRSIWNEKGELQAPDQFVKTDYFQNVALETKNLTHNIKNIFKEVEALAPMLTQMYTEGHLEGNQEIKTLMDELAEISKAIESLQEIQEKLFFESGLDPKNRGESFWKTSSLKREVELKLEAATQQMQRELSQIQANLVVVVKAILKKSDKD